MNLAGLIAYDRTTITGVVDRLVQKGLVDRNESERDRRARELKITATVRRTFQGIIPLWRGHSGHYYVASKRKRPQSWCVSYRKQQLPVMN